MELQIEIQTIDSFDIAKDLFGTDALNNGKTEKTIAEGVKLRYDGVTRLFTASVDSQGSLILQFAVLVGQNVVLPTIVGILSSYLYDKLKERKAHNVKIGDTYVPINLHEIYQAVMKAPEQKKDDTKT